MAQSNPGLAPRRLAEVQTVQMDVPERLQEEATRSSASEQPQVELPVETQTQVNTEATEPTAETAPQQNPTSVEDREFSDRASRRFQELANRTTQAEERARRSEEMLQRLVNTQPTVSQDDQLAKQYRTYDANLGYPTDPKEYSNYIGTQAELRATQAARNESQKLREQTEMNELLTKHPDVDGDDTLIGAIAALRTKAVNQGSYLTYSQAADIAKDRLSKKFTKVQQERIAEDVSSKNEAYVEGTRGASPNRSPETQDTSKMTLSEMEAYLKKSGNW